MSLFCTYADAGNQSRLYEEAIPLLESVDFDLALASPRLLARDVWRIATPHTLRQAQSLLADPEKADRLIIHMAKGLRGTEDEIGTAQQLLDQFIVGLTED
ncbi:MAG: hypothetical protein ACRED0_05750 [Gammaproteobacteria bacterium]